MSVGDESKSSRRASIASLILDRLRKSAIRRFATGCKSSELDLALKEHLCGGQTHSIRGIFGKNSAVLF